MQRALTRSTGVMLVLIIFLFTTEQTAKTQSTTELRGRVADESGDIIPNIELTLADAQGRHYSSTTDFEGRYRFANLAPGAYTLTIRATGFATFAEPVVLAAARANTVDATLKVVITEQIEVKPNETAVSVEPDQNLSATVLAPEDLLALPDDRDELLQMLRALSGGSDTGAVYVDGFSDDRVPRKESIQMVKINSNPFTAEFSQSGRNRIEVITKPGSERTRGSVQFDFNDEALNARNAFADRRAPLQIRDFEVELSGPILRDRWGYSFDFEYEAQDENGIINATVLDGNQLVPRPFFATVLTPGREIGFSFRTNYLLGSKHTFGLRYNHENERADNQGLNGGFDLPERAFDQTGRNKVLRFSVTSVLADQLINEFRLALGRRVTETQARNTGAAIIVLDAFSAGGNQSNLQTSSARDRLEVTNNQTWTRQKHTLKYGINLEYARFQFVNTANFGGTFTFGGDFERAANGELVLGENGQPVTITSLEHYRRTLLGLPGYRASQFSIARGTPALSLPQWEAAWFVQDDWRFSPRLTVSFGLRHEFNRNVKDRLNLAPRGAIAWAVDKAGNSVLRGGAGLFYEDIDSGLAFDVLRYDGTRQQQFILKQPGFFPAIPADLGDAVTTQSALRTKAPNLHLPYLINTSIGYERKLPWGIFGSISYNYHRGRRLLRTRNLNAPLVGTTERPFPGQGPILQYESTGRSIRHELLFNWRYRASRKVNLFGNYILASTRSDTDGASTAPADSYNLLAEFGRAGIDQRHRFVLGGSFSMPGAWQISPFLQASTGRPFNITTGRDSNGDTLFTDRPAFAASNVPEAVSTRYGSFNPNPLPGEVLIPRNFARGPGQVNLNLNFSKAFAFGEWGKGGSGKKGDGRYKLTLGANVRNLLNHTNPAGLSGVLSSSRFDTANRALAARRIELTLKFDF
jgi:hypothetical protein